MSLSPAELDAVAGELGALTGAFVQKVHLPRPLVCYVELRQVGRSTQVCLSAEPGTARLSVAQRRPSPDGAPPSLQRALRQRLIGARWMHVAANGVRVDIRFEKADAAWTLHAQLDRAGALWLEGQGGTVGAAPAPREGTPPADGPMRLRATDEAPLPLARAAEALLAQRADADRAQALMRAHQAQFAARRAKLQRTLAKVRAEAQRMPLAEEHRALGELLARNAARVERGARSVELTEYEPQGPVARVVPLDPRRSAKEQSAWHFKEYKRLVRGCEIAAARAATLERELAALVESDAGTPVARPAKHVAPRASPFHEYTSHGRRIFVGKDARGNDALTFSTAKPHDVWLHARGATGAHVVVAMDKKGELPQEVLLDAAHLALYHSALKDEPRGEVAYTRVKHVRRMKGGAPGQVTYTNEKTFVLRVERQRLTRVLNALTQSDRTP